MYYSRRTISCELVMVGLLVFHAQVLVLPLDSALFVRVHCGYSVSIILTQKAIQTFDPLDGLLHFVYQGRVVFVSQQLAGAGGGGGGQVLHLVTLHLSGGDEAFQVLLPVLDTLDILLAFGEFLSDSVVVADKAVDVCFVAMEGVQVDQDHFVGGGVVGG